MSSEWKIMTVSEIGEVVSGGTPSTIIKDFWDGEIVWITPADLSKINFADISTSKRKITLKGLENSSANLIPKNNIVLSSRAPIGYFAVPLVDFATNQGCKSIKVFSEQNTHFHYYNFIFHVNRFKVKGEGTTFAEISKKEIEKLKFKIPPLPQQKKIAQILSNCDQIIEQTQAAISKYQALKQGMMQDLFSRGIDSKTGKLRPKYEDTPELYKESELGWIPKEWEVKKLKEIAKINGRVGWKGYTTKDLRQTGPLTLGAAQINSENKLELKNTKSIRYEKYVESPEIMVNKGDVLIVQRGNTIGKYVLIDKEIGEATINPSMVLLNNIKLPSTFLYYTLGTELLRKQILNSLSQTGVPMISQAQIELFKIAFPINSIEIELISKKLETVALKISIEQSTLSKYQQIKTGLMQDVLTGKVAVPV